MEPSIVELWAPYARMRTCKTTTSSKSAVAKARKTWPAWITKWWNWRAAAARCRTLHPFRRERRGLHAADMRRYALRTPSLRRSIRRFPGHFDRRLMGGSAGGAATDHKGRWAVPPAVTAGLARYRVLHSLAEGEPVVMAPQSISVYLNNALKPTPEMVELDGEATLPDVIRDMPVEVTGHFVAR